MPENNQIFNLLFNPFEILPRKLTLITGGAVVLLAGWLNSFSNTHFDGLLDIHSGLQSSLGLHLVEGFINILIFTLLLFGLDKLVNKSTGNFGILFSQQTLARWPYLIVSIAMLKLAAPLQRYGQYLRFQNGLTNSSTELAVGDEISFYLSVAVMLLIMVWYVILSYRSFAGYIKASGWKTMILYSFGLIAAEVVSKIVVISLIK
ncbi:MAG: hypothetical protein ABIA75_11810 [Candidatus Neomarinimicrobiota bacterium]